MGICKSKEYTLEEKLDFLRKTPFSLHMSHRRLQHFGNYFQVRSYKRDATIYRQDEKADEFFIIARGEVKMWTRGTNNKDQFLCTKKAGDFFGERAVTEKDHVRPATVRCTTETLVLFINSELWRKYSLQAGDAMANIVTKIMGEKMSELLKKISFLSSLSDWKLDLLGNLFRYDTFDEGDHVFEEGDLGRELYIVSHGVVKVTAKDNEGKEVEFQTLKAGDYFGEIALMIDMPRTATVTAKERCLLLVLGLDDFRNFLNIVPDLKENFQQAVRERITKTLKKFKVPFFRSLPHHDLAAICSIHKYEAKQVIFKEGDPGTAFYLIVHGEVRVEQEGKTLAKLDGGAYFGEIALVTDKARTATVVVEKRAVLLSITKKDFMSFFAHNQEAYAEFAIKLSRFDAPLESVLLHSTGLKSFQEHLESEYSVENLHFYQAVKAFRERKNGKTLEEEATEIVKRFLSTDGPETVNVADYLRKETVKKIEKKQLTPELFDDLAAEILKLMSADSYKRFKATDKFKNLLEIVGSYEDQDPSLMDRRQTRSESLIGGSAPRVRGLKSKHTQRLGTHEEKEEKGKPRETKTKEKSKEKSDRDSHIDSEYEDDPLEEAINPIVARSHLSLNS